MMIHTVESTRPVGEIKNRLEHQASKHGFGVLAVHDLKKKMNDKGILFDREAMVLEVCRPDLAKRALEEAMDISTVLPCRFSIYDNEGKTYVSIMRPTAFAEIFGGEVGFQIAVEVENLMVDMMDKAA